MPVAHIVDIVLDSIVAITVRQQILHEFVPIETAVSGHCYKKIPENIGFTGVI